MISWSHICIYLSIVFAEVESWNVDSNIILPLKMHFLLYLIEDEVHIPAVYIILYQCKPYILKPAIVTKDRVAVYHIKTGPKSNPRPATRPT